MSSSTLTATDVKRHLDLLHEERLLAVEIGLAADGAYMADLEDEIVAVRAAYVGHRRDGDRDDARGALGPLHG